MNRNILKRFWKLLPVLALVVVLLTTAAMATEETFDTENFKGLVLTTSVGSDQVWVRLYKGYTTPKEANLIEPVYTEATADGGMAYYYEVAAGRYKCFSRHPSTSGRYYIEKSIYMTAEEVATKTVHDVTTGKRSTSGWDPSSRVYLYSDEVLAQIPSSPELWPDYADCFTTPAFRDGRNDHAITSQTEMMSFLGGLDSSDDDMYTYILGQSGGKALDIPLVLFTKADLSAADSFEEAAAIITADSEKNGKVTVYYQAQIHGYETASGEGALAVIQRLDGQYGASLLDKLNICVIPRLSPYGAYKVQRNVYLESGDIDPNGDFMRLRTVETQLRQKAINLIDPDVALDGHEFILSHESTSESRRDVLLAAHFLESQSEEFQEQSLNIADAIFDRLDENGLCYHWYDNIVNNVRGSVGSGNMAYRGVLHFLMETQGSDSGLTNYERRVVGQVSVATAVLDYAYENAETVRTIVRAQKQAIVEEGKTYEDTDQVVLEYGKELDASLAIAGNKIDLGSGKLTPTTFEANVWKTIVRSRTAPTAYVIPGGMSYTQAVLDLMDKQGITYVEIPAGATVNLQQYTQVTLNDSGKIIEAGLTDETAVSFSGGAYVFSMAQVNANILSLLMEPDVTQNTTNTLVQAGTVPVNGDGTIPIYRYIHDLNADGTIDYTIGSTEPAPAVEYTVYLDSVNGAATNDGYSQETAVNTIDLAYSQLTARMATAPAGTTGKLVIIGTYTQDGERILPSHDYPLLITGGKFIFKETDPAGDYRYLGMGGDTTFADITIAVGSASDTYYLYAQGHKFTIGKNVVCEAYVGSSGSHYFSISGGKKGGGTVANTDITIQSGRFTTVYVADYTGKVTNLAKATLSDCRVYRVTPSYIGNTQGDVYVEMKNVTVGKEILCGHRSKNSVSGDVTLVLGEGVAPSGQTQLPIYAGSGSAGNVLGTVTVIADGIDLTRCALYGKANNTSGTIGGLKLMVNQGELADVAEDFITKDGTEIILGCDQTKTATIPYSINLDLNGCNGNIAVADGKTATVCDTATDDFKVLDEQGYGVLTATGTVVAKDGYDTREEVGGTSYHRQTIRLNGVTLRPTAAGIYYNGQFGLNELYRENVECYGVVLSLKADPALDKEDCIWSELKTWSETGAGYGTVLTGIMTKDGGYSTNRRNADMVVYGVAYIKYADGTVEYSNHASYTLKQVVEASDTMWSDLTETQKNGLLDMYKDFSNVMKSWNIPNIKAAQ